MDRQRKKRYTQGERKTKIGTRLNLVNAREGNPGVVFPSCSCIILIPTVTCTAAAVNPAPSSYLYIHTCTSIYAWPPFPFPPVRPLLGPQRPGSWDLNSLVGCIRYRYRYTNGIFPRKERILKKLPPRGKGEIDEKRIKIR